MSFISFVEGGFFVEGSRWRMEYRRRGFGFGMWAVGIGFIFV